jgi:ADP-heptose:LPS heptosyltransferase
MTKLLVIRFSSIGDLVLTTPVLRAIKQQLDGDIELHVLTKKQYAGVLDGNPHVDRIHTMEKTVQEVLPQLLSERFDYIIDLHNNIRSRVVKRKLNCLSFTFKKYNIEKWLWVNFGINRMPQKHIVERYLDTLKAFGVKPDKHGLEYYITQTATIQESELPQLMKSPFIAFAVGAAHEGKRMSEHKLLEVCRSIRKPLVLLGGAEDKEIGNKLSAACGDKVFNACGMWTVHQSADAMRRAEMVIAGDTGMMHIAAALGKKIISLWGCTVPGLGMSAYKPHPSSIIVEPAPRSRFRFRSRPCSKLGNRCKYGMNNRCIDQIEIQQINAAIEMLWAPQTAPSIP